jgi:Protein of unknown function (DUF1559)
MIGEGAGGDTWNVCEAGSCPTPAINPGNGEIYRPINSWFVPEISSNILKSAHGFVTTSPWGSTIRPMNENPVMESYISISDVLDCRDSENGGPHRTSGFRSDHSGGAFFLMGDGSVRFLNELIDQTIYRGLSTKAGGEVTLSF